MIIRLIPAKWSRPYLLPYPTLPYPTLPPPQISHFKHTPISFNLVYYLLTLTLSRLHGLHHVDVWRVPKPLIGRLFLLSRKDPLMFLQLLVAWLQSVENKVGISIWPVLLLKALHSTSKRFIWSAFPYPITLLLLLSTVRMLHCINPP